MPIPQVSGCKLLLSQATVENSRPYYVQTRPQQRLRQTCHTFVSRARPKPPTSTTKPPPNTNQLASVPSILQPWERAAPAKDIAPTYKDGARDGALG